MKLTNIKKTQGKKIGVISLGCDKNRVDTEKMLSILSTEHTLTSDYDNANVIIINTCSFLESSRKEAIYEILSAIEMKKQGLEKIIVTGCLPQKFLDDIKDEFVEVDAFMGVSDYHQILQVIDRIYNGERVIEVGAPRGECGVNRVLTTDGYAYLKVADGCSNHCTYCLIPAIRGKYRSVTMADLIAEAKSLGDVNELILVAQDTAKYGLDLEPQTSLVALIRELCKLENVKGIRLMYCYPENITDELIHELAVNAKMIKYIDMPLQHADDGVLKLMNRKGTGQGYLDLIAKLKQRVPGIAIRSPFIASIPRESDEAFNNLTDFLQKAKLFNAGFFKYSKEDGTAAARLSGQVAKGEKTKRHKRYSASDASVCGGF